MRTSRNILLAGCLAAASPAAASGERPNPGAQARLGVGFNLTGSPRKSSSAGVSVVTRPARETSAAAKAVDPEPVGTIELIYR